MDFIININKKSTIFVSNFASENRRSVALGMLRSLHTYFLFVLLSVGYTQASIHFYNGDVFHSPPKKEIATDHVKMPPVGAANAESIDMEEEEDKRSFFKDSAKTSQHIGFVLLIVPGYSFFQTKNCLSFGQYLSSALFFDCPAFRVLRL